MEEAFWTTVISTRSRAPASGHRSAAARSKRTSNGASTAARFILRRRRRLATVHSNQWLEVEGVWREDLNYDCVRRMRWFNVGFDWGIYYAWIG